MRSVVKEVDKSQHILGMQLHDSEEMRLGMVIKRIKIRNEIIKMCVGFCWALPMLI